MCIAFLVRRFCEKVVYRADRFYVPFWLSLLGVELEGQCQFVGMPEITLAKNSQISIGSGSLVISRNFSTALGVAHPTVLRTLAPDAAIIIGNNVGISGASICAAKEVRVGDNCLFGADVVVADTDFHPISLEHRRNSELAYREARPILIGNNVFLGTRAIVLKGVKIGDNSVIGAGSIVCKDIGPNVVAAGNPARPIKSIK